MKKLPIKNPSGRPTALIDWKVVDQYLQAQCDGATIARILGIYPDTLYDAIVKKYSKMYGITTFSAYQQIKRREGLELLKRKQFDSAMSGNTTMQIWLGKQLLGQRDQIEQTITVPQVHIQPLNETEQAEISTAMIALEQPDESNRDIHKEPEGGNGE